MQLISSRQCSVMTRNVYAHFNLAILMSRHLDAPEKGREHLRAVIENPEAPEDLRQEARQRLESPGSS